MLNVSADHQICCDYYYIPLCCLEAAYLQSFRVSFLSSFRGDQPMLGSSVGFMMGTRECAKPEGAQATDYRYKSRMSCLRGMVLNEGTEREA